MPSIKNTSPVDLAYHILKNNTTNITINHKLQPKQGPITALPKYDIFETPTNYTISFDPIPPNQIIVTDHNFFTDGSCSPNPGKGAYGWFTPNFNGEKNRKEISAYSYPITITNCEIMAIHSLLTFIKNKPSNKPKVNIFTDCQTFLQYLDFTSFPKYNNIKLIMESIFKTLSIIQYKNPNLTIKFYKVKSHSNISGNNTIDKLVRHRTKYIKYNKTDLNCTPYSVTLTQVHKYVTKQWKSMWKIKSNPNKWITKLHNKYNTRIHSLINISKLNTHQCGIMVRLLTEHIELNQYLFKLQLKCPITKQIPPSPNCGHCEQIESVNHFLTKCTKYKFHRKSMYEKLTKINHKYKYIKFQTIKFLLFPYLLQHNNIHKQILIWKEILSYTKSTNRFKNLYQIDLNQI